MPIVSLLEALKALVSVKELTSIEYYRLQMRLRAGNVFFIPLEAGEILHHLLQARVNDSGLSETPELGVLRRYWAVSLLRGTTLQRPNDPENSNQNGETAFLQESLSAISTALAGLWAATPAQGEDERKGRADWLLQALYVDHTGIRSLANQPIGPMNDVDLVGVSLGALIMSALQMRVTDSHTPASIAHYVDWLYQRVLQGQFEREHEVLESTGKFVRTALRAFWQTVASQEHRTGAAVLLRWMLDRLPEQLARIVQADEEFNREMPVQSVPLVVIGDLRFSKSDYLEAARRAVNGRQATAGTWRSDEKVLFETVPDEPLPAISLSAPKGERLTVADSLLGVLYDRPEDRQRALASRLDWFDCDPTERTHAIQSIAREQDPAVRFDQAQSWRDSSAAVFYASLARTIEQKGSLTLDELRPPSAEALLRHYRLSSHAPRESLRGQLELGAAAVADEMGIAQAFVRYAGLPVPLPATLLERVTSLPELDKRRLVKTLHRTAGSPVSQIHFIHLLAHLASTPNSPYWRLATAAIAALLRKDQAARFSAFQAVLLWTDGLLGTWHEARSWSAASRLAMVWAHAHRVFSAMTHLGADPGLMSERFRRLDFGLSYVLFDHPAEYAGEIAYPRRVVRESFTIAGLSYAVGDRGADWWDERILRHVAEFVHADADDGSATALSLLRDPSLGTNTLGAFLDRDRGPILRRMLGDEPAEPFATESLKKLFALAESVRAHATDLNWWRTVYYVLGDLRSDAELAQSMESVILNIDLAPLAGDLQACETVLYAASLQAVGLRIPAVPEHLSQQVVGVVRGIRDRLPDWRKAGATERHFFIRLFQIVAHLAWASPDPADCAVAFMSLMTQILDACPPAAPTYAHLLYQIWPCTVRQSVLVWPLLVRSRAALV